MQKKILILIALLIMLIDFSSCKMHDVHGTPYKIWSQRKRTHNHWGREKRLKTRHMFWGRHRYGPRPYRQRGHYNY